VTGGNRGIGFEVVRGLVLESDLDKIILCSRSIKNGEEAVQKLQDEFGQKSNLCEVAQLDLANGESIENFAAYIKSAYGMYNVLICNAGIADELQNDQRPSVDKLLRTVDINFGGTEHFLRLMYPLANNGARIVAVSSVFSLRCMLNLNSNPNKRENLNFAEETGNRLFSTNGYVPKPEELVEISKKFKSDWKEGKNDIWPGTETTTLPGYDMSKLLLNNLVRYYASQTTTKERNLLINAICPGFCATDLNSMVPVDKPKTSADGAEMVLSMALIPAGFKRPNGTFLIDV